MARQWVLFFVSPYYMLSLPCLISLFVNVVSHLVLKYPHNRAGGAAWCGLMPSLGPKCQGDRLSFPREPSFSFTLASLYRNNWVNSSKLWHPLISKTSTIQELALKSRDLISIWRGCGSFNFFHWRALWKGMMQRAAHSTWSLSNPSIFYVDTN